jgi:site-specific DNA recombinase
MPHQAIILARISDARDGDERGVTDQLADGETHAHRIGWTIGPRATHHIVENDTSAFKRKRVELPDGRTELRTVRPGFRTALAMLARGSADGLIAYDLDRTARDPRDLEDLIDVIEASMPRIPVESVTGSLKLATDADVTMARVMVAVANKSSRDTARRVARARLRQATSGQYGGGGKRPFGFDRDGVTICEAEAEEIRDAIAGILSGVSLRQLAASMRYRDVPTVTGAKWSAETLRDILIRPRNAGLMVHRASPGTRRPYTDADIVGTAQWAPIVKEATWRAAYAILTDPARRNGPGNTPRWLGSRIYRCGKCDDGTTVAIMGSTKEGKRSHRYTCRSQWHIARDASLTDEFVEAALKARLRRPDAVDLIPAAQDIDLAALRAEEASLRELLDEQARLHARKVIDGRQLEAGSGELRARLEEVRGGIATAEGTSPLARIAGRPDVDEIWEDLTLGHQRAILRALADVSLLTARRGRGFDTDSVDIDFTRSRR